MKRILKPILQLFTFIWLLTMLFGLPGFSRLVESQGSNQSVTIQNGSMVSFLPLVVKYRSTPSPLLISEVLFNPSEPEPYAEWVELYNHSKLEIDLTVYMIGDSHEAGGKEGMYFFPPGATILPDDVIVIAPYGSIFEGINHFKPDFELRDTDPLVPDMILNSDWAEGFMSLNNEGDEVFLLFTSGQPVDLVSWGNSTRAFSPSVPTVDEGHSIERYPPYVDTDTNSDWRDQPNPSPGEVDRTPPPTPTPMPATVTPTPTPTAINTPTPTGTSIAEVHMLISEVLYDPMDAEPQSEWIEIYNPKSVAVDLSDYEIGDEDAQGGGEGMLQFPPGTKILPGERIVIAHNAEFFYSIYDFKPDFEMDSSMLEVPDMLIYSPWGDANVDLDNTGDEVLLIEAGNIVIDALSWGTSTWAFNPSCTTVDEGHSLERYPADDDTDSAIDWRDQASPTPGV